MTRFSDSQPIRNVLIVEDSDEDAGIILKKLASFEFACIMSVRDVTLEAAIRRLARTRFHVVIADLNLHDGTTPAEVMERLPDACREAALIVVSGMTPDLLSAAMDSKIEGVLPKTADIRHETLEAQVVQAVTRKQAALDRHVHMSDLEDRVSKQAVEISQMRTANAEALNEMRVAHDQALEKMQAAHNADRAEQDAKIANLEGQLQGQAAGVKLSKGMLVVLLAGVAGIAGAVAKAIFE